MRRGKSRQVLAVILSAALLFTARAVFAWQGPGELPTTPRLDDDNPATDEVAPVLPLPDPGVELRVVGSENTSPGNEAELPARDVTLTPEPDSPQLQLPPRQPAPAVRPVLRDASRDEAAENDTSAEPKESQPKFVQLKALVFRGAEPGRTTAAQLVKLWGEPQKKAELAGGAKLTFRVEPFPRVEASIRQDVLASLVVYFERPLPAEDVSRHLSLTECEPVEVTDATGKALGRTFAERGVTFGYGTAENAALVAHLLLEPLSSEPFVLRVKNDRQNRWQQNLQDLETSIRLTRADHRAWWLKAELLWHVGDYQQAEQAIAQAVALSPQTATYQLTAARLYGQQNRHVEAVEVTRKVALASSAPPIVKARAHLQWGDLLADAPDHQYQQALAQHQKAIELAVPLATADRLDVRRAAKRILIDAHLGIAHDIAQGRWKKQDEVVPLWLNRSKAFVDEMLESEMDSSSLPLVVSCQSLAAYAWLDGKVDPTKAVVHAQAFAQKLVEETEDPLYQRHIRWQLGKALVDAVDVERTRGKVERAQQYGKTAEDTLKSLAEANFKFGQTQFQLTRLYFLLGSLQAVQLNDHAKAIEWFEKAIDDLSRPEPDPDLLDTARRGEWLVSMGISYWHQGDQRRGLKLTQVGAGLIEAVHREGKVEEAKLAAPYNNLAFMHQQLGNSDQANHFAGLAAKIDRQNKSR